MFVKQQHRFVLLANEKQIQILFKKPKFKLSVNGSSVVFLC